jgi:hypothetical protein
MKSMAIVISLNIFKEFPLCMVYINLFVVVVPFSLQGSEKGLCHGIVPTIAFSAHTLNEAETIDCTPEIITCILTAVLPRDDGVLLYARVP